MRQFWLFTKKPVFSFLTPSTDVILLLFVHFIYRSPTLSVRDRFQDHQWIPETMDSYQTLYILFPTHTYLWLTYKLGTALDYPNCQPASPPFGAITDYLKHKYCGTRIVDVVTKTAAKWLRGGTGWTEGCLTSQAGWNEMLRDFTTLLRMAHNFKFMNFLWNFPFSDHSWLRITTDN